VARGIYIYRVKESVIHTHSNVPWRESGDYLTKLNKMDMVVKGMGVNGMSYEVSERVQRIVRHICEVHQRAGFQNEILAALDAGKERYDGGVEIINSVRGGFVSKPPAHYQNEICLSRKQMIMCEALENDELAFFFNIKVGAAFDRLEKDMLHYLMHDEKKIVGCGLDIIPELDRVGVDIIRIRKAKLKSHSLDTLCFTPLLTNIDKTVYVAYVTWTGQVFFDA